MTPPPRVQNAHSFASNSRSVDLSSPPTPVSSKSGVAHNQPTVNEILDRLAEALSISVMQALAREGLGRPIGSHSFVWTPTLLSHSSEHSFIGYDEEDFQGMVSSYNVYVGVLHF